MPKMTPQERAALEAQLLQDDEADDDDANFAGSWWEEDPKTGRRRGGEVTGRTGLGIMRKWAPDLFEAPQADESGDGPAKKPGTGPKPKTPAARPTVFGNRKTT
jgi:hypothetical protein